MAIVFFHMLFILGKYGYEKLRKMKVQLNELYDNGDMNCVKMIANIFINNCQIEDQFYDDNDNAAIVKFSPPAFIQRYNAVSNVLRSSQYCHKIHKVVDFGCSELGFFKHLKNVPGIREILCVDIDKTILEMNKKKIQPLSADYLHTRDHPLNVYIYEGSVTQADKNLQNSDAIICIELIEHLHPETLINVPQNIFEYIQPQLAIFTTPNADFNVLFPNMIGFRHEDHKFEWTRREFENWSNNIVNKYPNYEVKFEGIGPGPSGTEKYGCCSQMAIFNRRENITSNVTLGDENLFKLIANEEYPFHIDNRSDEVKIFDEASYFIRRYQLNNECDDETMPIEYLMKVMDNVSITIESLREILSNAGYEIIDNELQTLIILPPMSVFSDFTNNSNVALDDWADLPDPIDSDLNYDIQTNPDKFNIESVNDNLDDTTAQ